MVDLQELMKSGKTQSRKKATSGSDTVDIPPVEDVPIENTANIAPSPQSAGEDFETFAAQLGLAVRADLPNVLKGVQERVKITTIYGEVTLAEYEALLLYKIYSYTRLGIAHLVADKIREQHQARIRKYGGQPYDKETLRKRTFVVLWEMAQKEVQYGLRPLEHMAVVAEQVFIKRDGWLYYAHTSGKLKDIRFEVMKDGRKDGDNVWMVKCTIERTDGRKFEGIGEADPGNVHSKNAIEKMAYTRAFREAAKYAFPLGADIEEAEEVLAAEQARELKAEEPHVPTGMDLSELLDEGEMSNEPKED